MSKIILDGITLNDLESRIEAILDRKLSTLSLFKANQDYLTRAEVRDLLHISYSSLHRYATAGILIPCRIGNKVFFSRASIDKVLLNRGYNNTVEKKAEK